jgi:hypothetical protein
MTINSRDVRLLSAGPGPGGVPLDADELDRIAAVQNRSCTHPPACEPTSNPSTTALARAL